MRPTLLNLEQVDVVEKIIAGFDPVEVLKYFAVNLVDRETGQPLMNEDASGVATIEYSWAPSYAKEAFVTVIDAFLLSDQVQIVCPLEGNVAIVPEHSRLIPAAAEFLSAVIHDPQPGPGALDLQMEEWLDDGRNGTDVMFVRAYNGQYGDVALRLGPADFRRLQERINEFNASEGADERFDESGVLWSEAIFRAYDRLSQEYDVRVGPLFKNQTEVVLPPLTSTFLHRLPAKLDRDVFIDELFKLRGELLPVRQRFGELQEFESAEGTASIAQLEKLQQAIEADARKLARAWDQNITDNVVVQFCIDNLSFLAKLIVKLKDVSPAEVAERVASIAPPLEKYLRSSAPTVLSAYALNTRRMEGISQLFEQKLGIRFSEA